MGILSTDSSYVYDVTSSGMNITDITSEYLIAYVSRLGGFTSIWSDEDYIYLGTLDDSIKTLNKVCISGSIYDPYDLSSYLFDYAPQYGYTGSLIRHIHGNGDFISWTTESGIDLYKKEPQGYRSCCTTVSGNAYKCFMTSDGVLYYTVSGTEWSVERLDYPGMDWTTPNVSYAAGGAIIASGVKINDIFVTSSTSSDGVSNTLFIATSSGVYVIDEGDNSYDSFFAPTILAGDSNNFIAIWADPTASLTNGRFYASSTNAFSVVDSSTKSLYDFYTPSHAGRCGEALLDLEILDINC